MMELEDKRCTPCEGEEDPLDEEEEEELLEELEGWEIDREETHKIIKTYELEDFHNSLEFVNTVGRLAERAGHHPNILIEYDKVTLELWTHATDGLSENDFILASKIDEMN